MSNLYFLSGVKIFGLINAELEAHDIPWENCLALGSDNANVMVGKEASLWVHDEETS